MFTFSPSRRSWALRTVNSLLQRSRRRPSRKRAGATEQLEDRALLATFTVTNVQDAGAGSLRQAVADANAANGADDIVFNVPLPGAGIVLGSQLVIDDDVTIDGTNLAPAGGTMLIDGNNATRIFHLDSSAGGVDVTIRNLNMVDGRADAGATPGPGLGGAIYNELANLDMVNVTVSGNVASDRGGAIYNQQGSVNIVTASFLNNIATNAGGAFATDFGNVVLDTVELSGNASANGGAIDNNGATFRVERSTVRNNNATAAGGGIFNNGTLLSLSSTWSGNDAGTTGGGIHNVQFAEIANTTLSGNDAVTGGGVYNDNTAVVTNSTITQNSGLGGGIYTELASGRTTRLFNTIVAGNTDAAGIVPSDLQGRAVDSASNNNIIGDQATSGGLFHGINGNQIGDAGGVGTTLVTDTLIDPLLLNNGGPTETHALLRGSIGEDTGDNNRAAFAGINGIPDILADGDIEFPNDQRGADPFRRIWEDLVDVGAYEIQPLIVDLELDESDGDFSRGDFSLREALEVSNRSAGEDEIAFDIDLNDPVIVLDDLLGQLDIFTPIGINGRNLNGQGGYITIDGNNTGRILYVNGVGATVPVVASLENLTLTGGHADGSDPDTLNTTGGAILSEQASLHLANLGIFNSTADLNGGAVANVQGTLVLTNATISGNNATFAGGGLYNEDGVTSAVNSTITGNTAGTSGSGIQTFLSGGSQTHLYNTIVAGNLTAGSPQDLSGKAIEVGAANNLIGTAAASGGISHGTNGNIVGNSGLGTIDINTVLSTTPADNGGPNLTHALVAGSPATDAGDNNRAALPGTNFIPDIAGDMDEALFSDGRAFPFERIFNGTVDIGAYEDQLLLLVVDTGVEENDSDFSDGDFALREAIRLANLNPGTDKITFNIPTPDPVVDVGGQLVVTSNMILDGTNPAGGVAILDGLDDRRIMLVDASTSPVDVSISNLVFTNGSANGLDGGLTPESGGAILSRFARIDVSDVEFRNNTATDSGGAVYNEDGILLLTDTSFTGNHAEILGGGLGNDDGSVQILTSTFSQNTAGVDGGAIFNNNGPLTLENSTVSGNSARVNAGGIYNEDDTVVIVNSTIVGNRADSDGNNTGVAGGVFTVDDAVTFTNIFNSIVAGNVVGTGTTPSDVRGKPLEAVSANNLIGDANSAGGLVDGVNGHIVGNSGVGTLTLSTILDPVLANNGGTTATHALAPGSPALDAGDSNRAARPGSNFLPDIAADGDLPFGNDQRGFPFTRVFGSNVDMGAYEVTSTWIVDTDSDADDNDLSAGNLSIREAVRLSNTTPGAATIQFDLGLPSPVITISEQLILTSDIVIDGSNLNAAGGSVSLQGDGTGRLIAIDGNSGPVTVGLTHLTLNGGNADGTDPNPFNLEGGGIFAESANVWISNSVLSGNSAVDGGAIMSRGGSFSVDNTTFVSNLATRGAGFLSFGATTSFTDSTFDSNTAAGTGGGIFTRGGTVNVVSSTLTGNSALDGGAIANELSGNTFVSNSTLSGNFAQRNGAGAVSLSGFTVLTNSTVTGNVADADDDNDGSGGGIWTAASAGTRLYNTIIAGNLTQDPATTGTLPGDLDGSPVVLTSSNNLIGDAATAGGLVHGTGGNIVGNSGTGTLPIGSILDPVLASNGGSATLTHALVTGSPAIDAGDSNRAALPGVNGVPDISADGDSPLTFDQRGTPHTRVTGLVDIGAYEVTTSWVVDTATDIVDGDFSAGEFSLREAIQVANANPGTDTITFDISLSQSDIVLSGTELSISEDLTINGLGAGSLAVDGGGLSRLMHVMPGVSATVRHVTLTNGNTAGAGGAIWNQGTLLLEDAAIVGNVAANGGGLMLEGPATIRRSEISGNTAAFGGGIDTDSGLASVVIDNSTISSNTATGDNGGRAGAGVHAADTSLTFVNSTIANNVSSTNANGAGIAIDDAVGMQGIVALVNSIVADNTTTGTGPDVFGEIIRSDHSLIKDNSGFTLVVDNGGNLFGVDPQLSPLAVYNGQTATHLLSETSPAINAGDNGEVTLPTDQTGQPRQSGAVDMGAQERLTVAVDDGIGTTVNTPIVIDVLANDTPPSGTEVRRVVSGPATGSVVVGPASIEYTPAPGVTGTDQFEYEMALQSLKNVHPAADSELGHSVAVSGDWMVVGGQSEDGQNPDGGTAVVYRRTGSTWTLFQAIDADDEDTLDRYGYDVAIDGTTIVVGSRMDDDMGLNSGSAYVWEYDATQDLWFNTAKLLDTVTGSAKDQFGHSVAIQGDTIVVGARLEDAPGTNSGAAIIFERVAGGWARSAALVPADSKGGDQFGFDVAIDGDLIAVGARKDDSAGIDTGSVYIFERSGGTWTEMAEIVAANSRRNNWFGFAVDVSGDTVAVGMPIRPSRFRAGEVQVFDRNAGGANNWGETARLLDPGVDPETDQFGYAVALDGDRLAIGSERDDTVASNAGNTYLHARNQGGADNWGLVEALPAADGEPGDNYGHSLALDGDTLAIGAPLDDDSGIRSGAVYVEDLRRELAEVVVTVNAPQFAADAGPGNVPQLTEDQLRSATETAVRYWEATGRLNADQLARLATTSVRIADLDGLYLGLESGGTVLIDADAAGHGWQLQATTGEHGRHMDLPSVVAHELGHVLGYQDLHDVARADNLMYETLDAGQRRLPASATHIDSLFSSVDEDDELFAF